MNTGLSSLMHWNVFVCYAFPFSLVISRGLMFQGQNKDVLSRISPSLETQLGANMLLQDSEDFVQTRRDT